MDPTSIPPINAQSTAPQTPAAPSTPPSPELPKQPEKLLPAAPAHSVGALIGIVIIILVLIVGALYFWGAKLAEEESAGFVPEEASEEIQNI